MMINIILCNDNKFNNINYDKKIYTKMFLREKNKLQ